MPPTAVGVGYCPHNDDEDVLPTQELNNMEIATSEAGSRFTMNRCWNYTCIDATDSRSIESTCFYTPELSGYLI